MNFHPVYYQFPQKYLSQGKERKEGKSEEVMDEEDNIC